MSEAKLKVSFTMKVYLGEFKDKCSKINTFNITDQRKIEVQVFFSAMKLTFVTLSQ